MQNHDTRGMLYALAGFLTLSIGDAVVKSMAGLWAPTAIAALRFALGAAGLSALLLWREGVPAFRPPVPGIQLLRGLGIAVGTIGFFSALSFMPLAEATAITFTSPFITSLLAAAFLGEQLRRAQWMAMLTAFAGVLIVLRPNFLAIGWPALLPLLSAAGISMVMIGNRMVAGRSSALSMQAYVALAACPLLFAAAALGDWSGLPRLAVDWPDWSITARCAFVAVTASTAHWLIYFGTARAGAAAVAPMTYVQLVVATLLGWLVFGDVPDAMSAVGAAIIVGAGLFLLRRPRETQGA